MHLFSQNHLYFSPSARAILLIFVVLASIYSIVNPIMESPDEEYHVPVLIHIANTGTLPVQKPGLNTLWEQEGSQPPLYYLVSAILIKLIDTTDLAQVRFMNPHATVGQPELPFGKNKIIHSAEAFPWRGSVLAIHLVRFFSITLAAGTLLFTYLLANSLFPKQPYIATGSMALTAFNPMFLFISASVNNDNLTIFLSSLVMLVLVRMILRKSYSSKLLLALAVLIGLACLTKLSGLVLLPLSILTLSYVRLDAKNWRLSRIWQGLLADMAFLAAVAAGLAAWWYVRNWQLYGELTGLATMVQIVSPRAETPTAGQLVAEFQGFRMSYWGLFGSFMILMQPVWLYKVMDAFTIICALGIILRGFRTQRSAATPTRVAILLLALWVLITFLALIRWTSTTMASQGRLMFPTIAALSLFMVMGFLAWVPERIRNHVVRSGATLWLLLAVLAPFLFITPAYARPQPVVAQMPATAQRLDYRFADIATLIGFELDKNQVAPGDYLVVTLYWQVNKRTDTPLSVFVHVNSLETTLPFAQTDLYPVDGSYPTTWWQPGEIVKDRILVPISADTPGPIPAWVSAGLYQLETATNLPVYNTQGDEIFPLLTKIQITQQSRTLQPAHPNNLNFNNLVQFIGYDQESPLSPGATGNLEISLYWQVDAVPQKDYKVFLHVIGPDNRLVAQVDELPTKGFYSPVQWQPGEIIKDTHRIELPSSLPAGSYQVMLGLYDPSDGVRLDILDQNQQPVGNSAVVATFEQP